MADLAPGGSISVNGACLTVTSRDDQPFSVDLVPETLRQTNLGSLDAGGPVKPEASPRRYRPAGLMAFLRIGAAVTD